MGTARHGTGSRGLVRLVCVLLVSILSLAPAFELACDGANGESHEYRHAHGSPAVLAGGAVLPPVSAHGVAPIGRRPGATSALAAGVFVPPRA